jgi:hypothetical protein
MSFLVFSPVVFQSCFSHGPSSVKAKNISLSPEKSCNIFHEVFFDDMLPLFFYIFLHQFMA